MCLGIPGEALGEWAVADGVLGIGFTGKQGTYVSPLARNETVRGIKGDVNDSDAWGGL